MALVLVLIVCLLVFASVMIVFQSMQQGQTHRQGVDSYVRAIFIAEAGFNRLLARLQATGWEDRWFRDGPALEQDVVYSGGKYSSLIADSPSDSRTADVLVTGQHEKSSVRMIWRLKFTEQSLSLFPQITTVVFRYVDDEIPAGSSSLGPLVQRVDEILQQRGINREHTGTLLDTVRAEPTLTKVLEATGLADPQAVTQVTGLPALGASLPGVGVVGVPALPELPLAAQGVPIPVPQVNPSSGSTYVPGSWWPQDPFNTWAGGKSSKGPFTGSTTFLGKSSSGGHSLGGH